MLHSFRQNAMNDAAPSASVERESSPPSAGPSCRRPLLPRLVAWCAILGWRSCVDWRTKRPFLMRASAHLSVIVLTLSAVFLAGLGLPAPRAVEGRSLRSSGGSSPGIAGPTAQDLAELPALSYSAYWSHVSDGDTIARLPVAHTMLPNRLRKQVITYVVSPGDTVFGIASWFGLTAETIVWSNREGLMDAPWLIKPGLELFIPPVDGVYHTVRAGETISGIAAGYDVASADLYNEWNALEEGEEPREGQLLVVPGGVGEEVSWEPPPRYPRPGPAGYSYGVCGGVQSTGPGANGWFALPTGSREVSGWYFRDPRNPAHIGLDYRCRTGDPVYAADNGVLTIAGWAGGYGILAEINHGNGFVTRYGHLSQLALGCGHSVSQGAVIGYCGSTGWSSGAHLHFEIRHNGEPQDPLAYQP